MDQIRLNKYLASIGIASRRKIDEMISAGKIKINEKTATMGQKIDPKNDKVYLNNQLIKIKDQNLIYILLNKPQGYLSSTKDDQNNRPTVLDLIHENTRLYPIGRLDYNSEGLIILTNDGDLTQKLTHPKYHIEKTYIVDIFGIVTEERLEKLRNGIELEEGMTKPAKVRIINQINGKTTLEFIISEGKKRQIRRMCSAVRFHILKLIRTKIGNIELGTLKTGKWRRLSKTEVEKLKS